MPLAAAALLMQHPSYTPRPASVDMAALAGHDPARHVIKPEKHALHWREQALRAVTEGERVRDELVTQMETDNECYQQHVDNMRRLTIRITKLNAKLNASSPVLDELLHSIPSLPLRSHAQHKTIKQYNELAETHRGHADALIAAENERASLHSGWNNYISRRKTGREPLYARLKSLVESSQYYASLAAMTGAQPSEITKLIARAGRLLTGPFNPTNGRPMWQFSLAGDRKSVVHR